MGKTCPDSCITSLFCGKDLPRQLYYSTVLWERLAQTAVLLHCSVGKTVRLAQTAVLLHCSVGKTCPDSCITPLFCGKDLPLQLYYSTFLWERQLDLPRQLYYSTVLWERLAQTAVLLHCSVGKTCPDSCITPLFCRKDLPRQLYYSTVLSERLAQTAVLLHCSVGKTCPDSCITSLFCGKDLPRQLYYFTVPPAELRVTRRPQASPRLTQHLKTVTHQPISHPAHVLPSTSKQ